MPIGSVASRVLTAMAHAVRTPIGLPTSNPTMIPMLAVLSEAPEPRIDTPALTKAKIGITAKATHG